MLLTSTECLILPLQCSLLDLSMPALFHLRATSAYTNAVNVFHISCGIWQKNGPCLIWQISNSGSVCT